MEIYHSITDKISNLIRFWERFNLTLPGRLTIMKTCLISQLNYIGCFLPIPQEAIVNVQRMIHGFVPFLPVAADILYLPAELGGLSIFEVKKII